MHRTPKQNPVPAGPQPPLNYNLNEVPDNNEVQVDPEHQNPLQNQENSTKETMTYHPFINGKKKFP
jgi:hypothetical protein